MTFGDILQGRHPPQHSVPYNHERDASKYNENIQDDIYTLSKSVFFSPLLRRDFSIMLVLSGKIHILLRLVSGEYSFR